MGMSTFLKMLLLQLLLSVTTQRAVFKPSLSAFMQIMENSEQTLEEKNQQKHYQTSQLFCLSIFLKKKKKEWKGFPTRTKIKITKEKKEKRHYKNTPFLERQES